MDISLIVPVYNEQVRIKKPLTVLYNYFQKNLANKKWEIIFVNDGSIDETGKILAEFCVSKKSVRVIGYKKNRGKGYAISKGIRGVKGKHVFFLDIDLSVKPKEVKRALDMFKKSKADVVIGSRRLAQSTIVIHQPWLRETMGNFYTILTTKILGLPLSDLTCGFKGFKKEVAVNIFKNLTATRWSFDAEILYKAQNKGYTIIEMPITWQHVGNSKVNIGVDAIKSFIEIIRIRLLTPGVKRIATKV